jgi:Intracellular proteinase inhibitor
MRRILFPLAALLSVAAFDAAPAIDINPSKDNQPPSFWEGSGNRFSIFNGDPKRIQRANAVDPKSFDSRVEVSPNPLSIKALKAIAPNPSIKITFSAHNHAKKTYTLSFPTAQRWDFRILDATGKAIYVYSDNCEFEQKVGTSMVNNDDKLVYMETVDFDDLSQPLAPGTYTVETVLANYPEIHAQAQLTVQP